MAEQGSMDAETLLVVLKGLNDAISAGETATAVTLLQRMKEEVSPTEDLLRTTKAGSIMAKHRKNTNPEIGPLANEVMKLWKDVIEGQRKRKREAEEAAGKVAAPKKVKTEAGGAAAAAGVKAESGTASPAGGAVSTPPEREVKPLGKTKKAESSAVKEESKPAVKKEEAKTQVGNVNEEAIASGSGSRAGSPKPKAEPKFETIDKDRKVPRTAKADMMADIKAEDGGSRRGGEDPVRDKCVVMIYDALAGDSTASKDILAERAVSLERAVYEQFEYNTNNDYRAKIRSLFLNLKDKGNPGLRDKIVIGTLPAEHVVNMSKEEMASASVKALNEEIAKANLFKAKAVTEVQAETNAFKCSKCQQRRCSFYQMQTRSADEPMTTFATCLNCGHKWKFC